MNEHRAARRRTSAQALATRHDEGYAERHSDEDQG